MEKQLKKLTDWKANPKNHPDENTLLILTAIEPVIWLLYFALTAIVSFLGTILRGIYIQFPKVPFDFYKFVLVWVTVVACYCLWNIERLRTRVSQDYRDEVDRRITRLQDKISTLALKTATI
jgi:hypothetical protein